MSDVQRRRAEDLFQQAVDVPSEERVGFLDRHCPDDPDVRAEVESLLRHFEDGTVTSLLDVDRMDEAELALIGEHIGPYKLLQLIGEGGFGAVYMAEQEEPVRRQVALKIIKLGMDTKQVIARFEAERQALAMMDHPNIARVFDAGATDAGRPYFAMELVRGIPITEYCDRNSLSTRERLELFTQVCRAVQHAHQKGIIHRDIKPSNVLVTLHDGTAVPKVIDFGIAKAMSQRLTEKTLFTEFLQFIGTPQYMSPEQAEMSGLDIDTRSDIYSLGVLLYELLTGTTPFDPKMLRSAAYGEIQRIIREQEPPTPSHRLSTLGAELAEVAKSRRAEPQALSKLMRGDLDWIVMKALEKDRTRRYETASALAADIGHHLSHEPVVAGPPGAAYKFRKFVRRNRVTVVAGSLISAALLLGLALATAGFVQARRERDAADEAAARAQAISNFLQDMLASADPMQSHLLSAFAPDQPVTTAAPGGFARDVSVAEMVRLASTQIDQAFAGRPELEADARETMGMTLRGLGLYADARPQLQAALDIRRRELGDDHPDTLRAALALGDLMLDAGKPAEAEPLVRSAFEGMQRIYGVAHPRTLSCASILALVLSDQGKYKQSEPVFSTTLTVQQQVLGAEHRDTLTTMWRWSTSCLSQWKLTEGQALAHDLHEISSRTLSPNDSLNTLSRPLMGWWYLAQYRYQQAEEVLRPGLEQCRRILGVEHPFTYTTMHGLARALQGSERQQEKEQLYRRALEGLRATRGRLHPHTLSTTADFARWLDRSGKFGEAEQLYRTLVADSKRSYGEEEYYTVASVSKLADFLERMGELDEAVALHRERLAIVTRWAGGKGESVLYESDMLANALVRIGRVAEARRVTQDLLARTREAAEQPDADAAALNNHAWYLLICVPADMRDDAAALPLAEKAVKLSGGKSSPILDTLALAQHRAGDNDQAVETQMRSLTLLPREEGSEVMYPANLVRYLLHKGDTAAADRVIEKGVAMFRTALGEDNPVLAARFNKAGVSLADAGHCAMAEALLGEALELNRKLLGEEHEQVAQSLEHLGDVYELRNEYERAAEAYRAAIALRRKLLGDDHLLVAKDLHSLGVALQQAGQASKAASVLREVLGVYRELDAQDIPATLIVKRDLAQALVDLGDLDQAEPPAREALTKIRGLYGDEHVATAAALRTLGLLLMERGEAQQAEPLLRSCVDILGGLEGRPLSQPLSRPLPYGRGSDGNSDGGSDGLMLAEAENVLGWCLTALERFEKAEPLLLRSYEAIYAAKGDGVRPTRTALDRVIGLYDAWGKPELAAQWRARE